MNGSAPGLGRDIGRSWSRVKLGGTGPLRHGHPMEGCSMGGRAGKRAGADPALPKTALARRMPQAEGGFIRSSVMFLIRAS